MCELHVCKYFLEQSVMTFHMFDNLVKKAKRHLNQKIASKDPFAEDEQQEP